MIAAFSGHRFQRWGGYKLPNPTYIQVYQETKNLLLKLQPEKCISGMCSGYDQVAAFICIKLGIPFIAALPHINQEKIWPKESQTIYHRILEKASEVVILSEGEYAAYKMQVRNEWLVDNSDCLIACFDGVESGGTYNCIEYAKTQNKPIHIIKPIIQ